MKPRYLRGFAVLALLCFLPRARAVYIEWFDLFQGGYNDGGTVTGSLRWSDDDANGLISPGDTLLGSLIYRRPLGNGFTYVRGFDITTIAGPSILTGSFTIFSSGLPGNGSAVITNQGGTVINYDFPVTGNFTTSTSNQAPSIVQRVDDHGSSLALFLVPLLGILTHIHRGGRSRRALGE